MITEDPENGASEHEETMASTLHPHFEPDPGVWLSHALGKKLKILYELHRGIDKNRIEWEKEHQLVIENKCCENKNKNVEVWIWIGIVFVSLGGSSILLSLLWVPQVPWGFRVVRYTVLPAISIY
jgi:hypothetical protein